jgi:hypothetical protein
VILEGFNPQQCEKIYINHQISVFGLLHIWFIARFG